MKRFFTSALVICLVAGFSLAAPVLTSTAEAKGKAKKATKLSEEDANKELHSFATNALEKMNRLSIPSKKKEDVVKTPQGWMAKYVEIYVNTLQTSVAIPADTKIVDYVGYMRYVEVEYVCLAESKDAALNGTFKANIKTPMTELVKCVKGKWGY